MSLLLSSAKATTFYIPPSITLLDNTSPLTATISFNPTGTYTGTESGRWYLPPSASIGNDFEIYASEVGGPAGFDGTFDTWLSLSVTRTWSLEILAGSKTGQINFSLRRVGDSVSALTVLSDWYVEVLA